MSDVKGLFCAITFGYCTLEKAGVCSYTCLGKASQGAGQPWCDAGCIVDAALAVLLMQLLLTLTHNTLDFSDLLVLLFTHQTFK